MTDLKRLRPSPAMVVATVSLIVALSGIAWAQGKIRTKDIQARAVTSPKIASKAVKGGKIQSQAVKGGKIRADAVKTGKIQNEAVITDKIAPQAVDGGKIAPDSIDTAKIQDDAVGPAKIADGAVGATQLGQVVRRAGTAVSIADGDVDSASAACNAGEQLIGGGASTGGVGNDAGWFLRRSAPNSDATVWNVSAENTTGGAANLIPFALCLQTG